MTRLSLLLDAVARQKFILQDRQITGFGAGASAVACPAMPKTATKTKAAPAAVPNGGALRDAPLPPGDEVGAAAAHGREPGRPVAG